MTNETRSIPRPTTRTAITGHRHAMVRATLVIVAATQLGACQDALAPHARTASVPPITAPRALSVNTISDLGWGGASLVSHFALGINAGFATVGTATIGEGEQRAVRAASGSSATVQLNPTPGQDGAAYAISSDGSIVGYNITESGERGFVVDNSLGFGSYATLDATRRSVANDINDGGVAAVIAGWIESAPGSGTARAFHQPVTLGAATLIPNLTGGSWAVATKVSNTPSLVGYGEVTGGYVRAFLLAALDGSAPSELPRPAGCENSVAWSINDNATPVIVGYCDNAQGNIRAVRWVGGVVTDLGDFGGGNAVALDVNNAGDIVGYAMNAAGEWRPFIVRAGSGEMDELASLATGSRWGIASAVTERAGDGSVRVVGYVEDPNSVDRARPVTWTAN